MRSRLNLDAMLAQRSDMRCRFISTKWLRSVPGETKLCEMFPQNPWEANLHDTQTEQHATAPPLLKPICTTCAVVSKWDATHNFQQACVSSTGRMGPAPAVSLQRWAVLQPSLWPVLQCFGLPMNMSGVARVLVPRNISTTTARREGRRPQHRRTTLQQRHSATTPPEKRA